MSVAPYYQESSWETFRWYFERFKQFGLNAIPFYWSESLRKQDVDLLFDYLANYEVIILGGGSSPLGMHRYKDIGQTFYGDANLFGRALYERQKNGKLTIGFSAGASQLCEFLAHIVLHDGEDSYGFGIAKNLVITAHHEWGKETEVYQLAKKLPRCMAFGLPNDSGLAIDQGYLPSGKIWQLIEFILDYSWEVPEDAWHIRTKQGMKIEHFYCDGRHWAFNNGDKIVRVMSADQQYRQAWILQGGMIREYWSQQQSPYQSIEDILANQ